MTMNITHYTCHTCKTIHTEGNMVAHCAACHDGIKYKCKHLHSDKPEPDYDDLKARLALAEKVVAAARDFRNVTCKTFTRIGERAESINSMFKILTAYEKGE